MELFPVDKWFLLTEKSDVQDLNLSLLNCMTTISPVPSKMWLLCH